MDVVESSSTSLPVESSEGNHLTGKTLQSTGPSDVPNNVAEKSRPALAEFDAASLLRMNEEEGTASPPTQATHVEDPGPSALLPGVVDSPPSPPVVTRTEEVVHSSCGLDESTASNREDGASLHPDSGNHWLGAARALYLSHSC